MNAIKKIKSVFATGLVLLLVSCNSWLEVDPEDRIMDNTLFKDKEGFMTALNGVYSELNKTSLYGRNLTMGMIDVMAQYYNCNIADHTYARYMDYSYEDATYKTQIDNIWSGLYTMIANCNAIIEHCGNYWLTGDDAFGSVENVRSDLVGYGQRNCLYALYDGGGSCRAAFITGR